jgi:hypothetical protein
MCHFRPSTASVLTYYGSARAFLQSKAGRRAEEDEYHPILLEFKGHRVSVRNPQDPPEPDETGLFGEWVTLEQHCRRDI